MTCLHGVLVSSVCILGERDWLTGAGLAIEDKPNSRRVPACIVDSTHLLQPRSNPRIDLRVNVANHDDVVVLRRPDAEVGNADAVVLHVDAAIRPARRLLGGRES